MSIKAQYTEYGDIIGLTSIERNQNMDTITIPDMIKPAFQAAKEELGEAEYHTRLRTVFHRPVLDFVSTLVINLPRSCYAACWYCIDASLRRHATSAERFLESCERTFNEFKNIKEVAITGGSLPAVDFNKLIAMITTHYPDVKITWNTAGIMLDSDYNIAPIRYINLHRNGISEDTNRKIFKTVKPILSIDEAKRLFGDRLFLRVTIDDTFDLDGYASYGVPLYINRMMPATSESKRRFTDVMSKLRIEGADDIRRRNHYITTTYNGITVRVCVGDDVASHVPGRYPVYLNVVIIHRDGTVCGSWYLDDKTLYTLPPEKGKMRHTKRIADAHDATTSHEHQTD